MGSGPSSDDAGEDGKTSTSLVCSLFLPEAGLAEKVAGVPAVAAWLCAGAGVWTETKTRAVRGAEPAARPRAQRGSSNLPFLPFLPPSLSCVYFPSLPFLTTQVL